MDIVKLLENAPDIFRMKINNWVCWGSPWTSWPTTPLLLYYF